NSSRNWRSTRLPLTWYRPRTRHYRQTTSGPERGSLTVQCNYTSGWKTHKKYWCRGAVWSSCKTLVKTTGSEQEVKEDRVSIRDDQENLTFMVTMEDLRRDDADIYWCAIERVGSDHGFPVDVTIDPGKTRTTTVTSITVKTASNPSVTRTTSPLECFLFPVSCSHRSLFSSTSFLILVFLEVPLLLGMLSAVLWVNRPQRCPGRRRSPPDEN
uniref:Ig-like domain-containing protein n=1 Tax=Marmota marmota marmota TaxID=9994 RepID=A0A8C5ZCD9_MARMA